MSHWRTSELILRLQQAWSTDDGRGPHWQCSGPAVIWWWWVGLEINGIVPLVSFWDWRSSIACESCTTSSQGPRPSAPECHLSIHECSRRSLHTVDPAWWTYSLAEVFEFTMIKMGMKSIGFLLKWTSSSSLDFWRFRIARHAQISEKDSHDRPEAIKGRPALISAEIPSEEPLPARCCTLDWFCESALANIGHLSTGFSLWQQHLRTRIWGDFDRFWPFSCYSTAAYCCSLECSTS